MQINIDEKIKKIKNKIMIKNLDLVILEMELERLEEKKKCLERKK